MTCEFRRLRAAALGGTTLVAAIAAAGPALAHHPLAGAPMETFSHGILSGIGHPLLGFDHLFFVALVGIAAVFTGQRFLAPLAYIATMVFGCLLMGLGVAMPAAEIVIGLSLLVLGGVVLSGRDVSPNLIIAGFALAGLFHGSAFGGSIAGQEAGAPVMVLVGYLIGLAAIQYAIALFAGWALEKVAGGKEAEVSYARISGAVVAGMGLFLSLENAEGMAFSALGIG